MTEKLFAYITINNNLVINYCKVIRVIKNSVLNFKNIKI